MAQSPSKWQVYPIIEWVPLDGVSYAGMPVLYDARRDEMGYDHGECMLDLPPEIEAAIRSGAKGHL